MAAESQDSPPSAAGSQSQGRSSLYANLLNSDSSQSISRAPVHFTQPSPQELQQQADLAALKNAALRFQPTKRPLPAQKSKQKLSFPKTAPPPTLQHSTSADASEKPSAPAKITLADWTAEDDDVNGFYDNNPSEKRPRGGRKKRKKNVEPKQVIQDWDDIYDPSRPNIYEDYRHSEEKWREIKDWKDRLYAHRLPARRGSSEMSDDSGHRLSRNQNRAFAPPPNYAFAPPPDSDSESQQEPPPPPPEDIPPPPPPAVIHDDATGEDAYARRIRMSQMASAPISTPVQHHSSPHAQLRPGDTGLPAPPAPPQQPTGTISRAPVRYQLPEAPPNLPTSEAELAEALNEEDDDNGDHEATTSSAHASGATTPTAANDDASTATPRSNRPGQRGFAERLLSKYGWTKGSGLGATGTGIVNPLRVQVDKRKKRSDAEGGGFVGPAGKGRIIGSKTGKQKGGATAAEAQGADNADDDGIGNLSEVVLLRGMVDGLDLDFELSEGNLMQEIGDECTDKYGNVERVFIDRNSASESVPVFIKFTSQLSALKAVQALQGRIFNGNPIHAQYFDPEKFEAGSYE